MASLVKIIRNIVVVLVSLIVIAVAVVYALSSMRMSKKYPLVKSSLTVMSDAATINEGHRLFITRGCSHCHGPDLSGETFIDNPVMGTFAGANLTSGKGGAASVLSDSDFARAIRHGIGPNGLPLIFMPATDFQHMSDEDVGKIVAYVRSATPVDKPSTPIKVGPLARVLFLAGKLPLLVTAELIDHEAKAPVQVVAAETVEYGQYLANGCTGCHGEHFSGGPIPGGPPDWPPAANITPAGIGSWSEADFIKTIRTGVKPDGSGLLPPMPWQNLSKMTDVELKALWMFLRTVPTSEAGNR